MSTEDQIMLLDVALNEIKRMNKIITDLMQELARICRQRDDALLVLWNQNYATRHKVKL